MEEKNNKRVLRIELNNNVKKVSITGMDSDEKVVMRQELSEDDLELVTGGLVFHEDTMERLTSEYNNNSTDYEKILTSLWPDHTDDL